MDDNNFMNNDNQSSGTPDNTGVFGQSAGTANGSDTYSQPTDTYGQPVSQQGSGNAYAYGQASDQTGSTDGYVNNPGSAYGYANQGTYNQNSNACFHSHIQQSTKRQTESSDFAERRFRIAGDNEGAIVFIPPMQDIR